MYLHSKIQAKWHKIGFEFVSISHFQNENTIPWTLVVVTVAGVGANDKQLFDVFIVA